MLDKILLDEGETIDESNLHSYELEEQQIITPQKKEDALCDFLMTNGKHRRNFCPSEEALKKCGKRYWVVKEK